MGRDEVARGTAPEWRTVIREAQTQGGILHVHQGVDLGVPERTLRVRARREGWSHPFPKVFLLPGTPWNERVRTLAAARSVGAPAIVTGHSALALRGAVDAWPRYVQLLVPAGLQRRAPSGVRVGRSRTLRDEDHHPYEGVLLATAPRAFMDAASANEREVLRGWLIDAVQRRHTTVGDVLDRVLRQPGARGRRRLIGACHDIDATGADSVFVHHVATWLRGQGIPLDREPRTVATPNRVLHPDITIRGLKVAIEVDGFGAHASRRSLERDQRKHNAYQLAGWVVLRIGWERFSKDPDGFLTELRDAIALAEVAA